MNRKKKTELFLHQKETLDTFLSTGAISQAQYDKSYGDLVKKMGMEEEKDWLDELMMFDEIFDD